MCRLQAWGIKTAQIPFIWGLSPGVSTEGTTFHHQAKRQISRAMVLWRELTSDRQPASLESGMAMVTVQSR